MNYVYDEKSLDHLTEVFHSVNRQIVSGKSRLDLELNDGEYVRATCYSLHCTRNDCAHISCILLLEDESDYPREINLMSIKRVNAFNQPLLGV